LADMETKYLKGQMVDIGLICTVLNCQRRTFEAIGFQRRQRDVTPTLEQYLKEKQRP
jgi:hypothetical protein